MIVHHYVDCAKYCDTAFKPILCSPAHCMYRAKDSFGDWFDHYHREKPKPVQLPENPSFTEKVAYEQRTKQYQRDLER